MLSPYPISSETRPSSANNEGPSLAWRKQSSRHSLTGPTGKCLSDLLFTRSAVARMVGSLDLTRTVNCHPPGPTLDLGSFKYSSPPSTNLPAWLAGIRSLKPEITRCSRKEIRRSSGTSGGLPVRPLLLAGGISSPWKEISPRLPTLSPPHTPMVARHRALLNGIPASEMVTVKHEVPSPTLRQDTDRACYTAQLPWEVLCVLIYWLFVACTLAYALVSLVI